MSGEKIFKTFLTEFEEFLENLERELENAKSGKEINVFEIFRAFHTFKGSGALFEFNKFVAFSEKYTEHWRPIKDEKKLSLENVQLLEKLISELKEFKNNFKL
ncbi:MAG: Hpt domain-containing protein [Candidatus Heimdallarchaeota archaeon]